MLLCHAGSRSALATQQLQKSGLTRVASLRGGIRAWKAEGLSLEPPFRDPPQGNDSAGARKLVADCFDDEAAAVALDPVGSRPPARPDAAINPMRSTGRRARTSTLLLANHPGLLSVRPGLVYCNEQVVLGPANHPYAGSIMR